MLGLRLGEVEELLVRDEHSPCPCTRLHDLDDECNRNELKGVGHEKSRRHTQRAAVGGIPNSQAASLSVAVGVPSGWATGVIQTEMLILRIVLCCAP